RGSTADNDAIRTALRGSDLIALIHNSSFMDSYAQLAERIRAWGRELGFQQIGIADIAIPEDEARFVRWLEQGRHGEMEYMQRYGRRRARPQEIIPGTVRVISARMDYLPPK